MTRQKPDDGMRQVFRKHLAHFDWQSIETGGTGRGVPDSNFCWKGVEGWVEFKSTEGFAVGLRPEQIGWIARRVRYGGRVWIAVRRRHEGGPRKGPPSDDLHLCAGEHVVELAKHGLLHDGITRRWSGGPSAWDWRQIADHMVRLMIHD